eukprot:2500962-Amphidinium_carterae.1
MDASHTGATDGPGASKQRIIAPSSYASYPAPPQRHAIILMAGVVLHSLSVHPVIANRKARSSRSTL